MSSSSTVTLDQIAKRANVSRMTISNVLNGYYQPTQKRAVERAERIRAIAREMGYMPNAAAKAIRAGKFGVASLLLSTKKRRSTLPENLLCGMHDALAERDMRLEVARLPDESLVDDATMPKLLSQRSADGLLIDYTHSIPEAMVQIIREHHLPAVWINSKQDADCVHSDDLRAGYDATRRLLEVGHRRVGYIDYSHGPDFLSPHYSAHDRRRGYERAMREAGLPSRVYMAEAGPNIPGPQRVGHARQMLEAPDRPTAVVTYGRTEAAPIICAAGQIGLSVPEDLSLINIGEYPIGYLGPMLTTMILPQREMGRQAVDMLIEKIENPDRALPPRALPFDLEVGDSVAPPGRPGHE